MQREVSYDGKTFISVRNSDTGDVSEATLFHYHQDGDLVWATYEGGSVRFGSLVATADSSGRLDMRYQHLTTDGTLKTGECRSVPELLPDGRVRLHESWQWTSGGRERGESIVEELKV